MKKLCDIENVSNPFFPLNKKIFFEIGELQRFACKMLILLILSYIHHPCNIPVMQLMHRSELFDIFSVQAGS